MESILYEFTTSVPLKTIANKLKDISPTSYQDDFLSKLCDFEWSPLQLDITTKIEDGSSLLEERVIARLAIEVKDHSESTLDNTIVPVELDPKIEFSRTLKVLQKIKGKAVDHASRHLNDIPEVANQNH